MPRWDDPLSPVVASRPRRPDASPPEGPPADAKGAGWRREEEGLVVVEDADVGSAGIFFPDRETGKREPRTFSTSRFAPFVFLDLGREREAGESKGEWEKDREELGAGEGEEEEIGIL